MTHLGDARTVKYPVGKGHYGREQNYAPIEPPFGMTVREWANRLGIMNPKVAPTAIESDNPADFAEVTQRITMANRAYDRASRLRVRGTFPNAEFYIDEGRGKETPVASQSEAEKIIYDGLRLDIPGMLLDEKRQKRGDAISRWGGGNAGLNRLILKTHTEGRPTENDLGTWDDRSTPGMDARTTGPSTFDKWMGLDDSPSTTGMAGPSTAGPGAAPTGTQSDALTPLTEKSLLEGIASGQFQFGKKDDPVKTWRTQREARIDAEMQMGDDGNFRLQEVDIRDEKAPTGVRRDWTWVSTDPGAEEIRAEAGLRGDYRFEEVPGSQAATGKKMFNIVSANGVVLQTTSVDPKITGADIQVEETPLTGNKVQVTVLAAGKVIDKFTYDAEKPVELYESYEQAMNKGFAQGIPSSRIEVKSSVIDGKLQYYPTVGAMKYRPGIVTERELGGDGDRTFFRTEDGEFSELEKTFEPGVFRDQASGRQYQQNPDGSIKVLDREYQPGLVQTGPYTAFQQPTGQLSEVARRFEPGFITDAQGRELIQQPTGAVSQPRPVNMEEIITQALVDGDWDKALAFEDFKNRPTAMEAFQAALNFARSPADQQLISSIARGEVTVEPPPAGTIRRVGPQPDFLVEEYNTFQQRLRGGRPPTPAEQARYTQRHLEGRSPQYDQMELTLQQKDRELAQAREAAEALAGSYNEQLQALEGQMQEAFQTSFTPLGQELGVETPQWESVLADLMAAQAAPAGETPGTTYQGARSYTQALELMDSNVASGQYTQQQANEHLASMLASGYVSPITEEESALYNVTMQDYEVGGKYGATEEVQKPSYGWNLEQSLGYISKYHPDVSIPSLSAEEIRLASLGSAADWTQLIKIAASKSQFLPPGEEIETSKVDSGTGLFLKSTEAAVSPTSTVDAGKAGADLVSGQLQNFQQRIMDVQRQVQEQRQAQAAERQKVMAQMEQTRARQEAQGKPQPSWTPSETWSDSSNERVRQATQPFRDLAKTYERPSFQSVVDAGGVAAPAALGKATGYKAGGPGSVFTAEAQGAYDPMDFAEDTMEEYGSVASLGSGRTRYPEDAGLGFYAGGGMTRGNQLEVVGEEGPELVDLPTGSFVLPIAQLNNKQVAGLKNRGVPGYAGGGVVFGSQTLPLGIRQLQAGRQITPSRGYLSQQAGLTIPSVQAFQNLTPESRDIFRDTAMQAGIPARSFEQELALARPGGRRLPLARTLPVTRRGIR